MKMLLFAVCIAAFLAIGFCATLYAVASPTRGGSSNNLDVLATIDPATAALTIIGNLTSFGSVVPACFAIMKAPREAVVCSFQPAIGGCLTHVRLANSTLIGSQCFDDLVIKNVAYDEGMRHVYFEAVNSSTGVDAAYQWDRRAVLLSPLAGDVRWGISTYSSLRHLFIVVISAPCPTGVCVSLTTINVNTAKIVASAPIVDVDIGVLSFDDIHNRLFAIVSSRASPGSLVTIDWMSGKVSKAITSFKNDTSAGSVAIDSLASTMFAALNVLHVKAHPFLATIDVDNGRSTMAQVNDKHDSFIRSLGIL